MNYAMFNTVYQSYATNIIKMEEKVDPIHAIGACYCHECKFSIPSGHDFKKYLYCQEDEEYDRCVESNGFCNKGVKKGKIMNWIATKNDLEFGDIYDEESQDSKEELWNADPNCEHNIISMPSGGVKCTKCKGWCCY